MNTKVLLLVIATSSQVLGWHALGHMTVARIAANKLAETPEGQKALDWAVGLLNPYKDMCGEDQHPFTECASWPDKVKQQSWWSMANWHYSDQRFYAPGYIPPKDQIQMLNQNITWAIHQCTSHLSSNKQDTKGQSNAVLGKSISMRNLVHFMGDIHQPLHTTGRFSAEHPDGDLGGNLFRIPHWENLHAAWDHLFDQGPSEINSPLSEETNTQLDQFVKIISNLHPFESVKAQIEKNKTPESWTQEGYAFVSTFVYDGITDNEALPQDYVDKAIKIVEKRLALGGYRLAIQVQNIFDAWSKGTVQTQ